MVDRCEDEGINVTKTDDNHLQVTPDTSNPDDPLNKIDDMTIDEWLNQEARRMWGTDDDDEILQILLNSE